MYKSSGGIMRYCKCHLPLTMKQAIDGLKDECVEFIEEPSLDEFSDIIYCLNRLGGSIIGKPYLKLFMGDYLHKRKIKQRMQEYGCIRSKRHLINGKCPSL